MPAPWSSQGPPLTGSPQCQLPGALRDHSLQVLLRASSLELSGIVAHRFFSLGLLSLHLHCFCSSLSGTSQCPLITPDIVTAAAAILATIPPSASSSPLHVSSSAHSASEVIQGRQEILREKPFFRPIATLGATQGDVSWLLAAKRHQWSCPAMNSMDYTNEARYAHDTIVG